MNTDRQTEITQQAEALLERCAALGVRLYIDFTPEEATGKPFNKSQDFYVWAMNVLAKAPLMRERLAEAQATLARAARLFEEALPKFNWGASALDANAIQLLNEVPGEVRAVLKACALCGGEGHTAPNCPWAKEGGA